MSNLIVKCGLYIIYSIAVYLFIHFLNLSYVVNIVFDWLVNSVEDGEVYEYIIVGAGSAGATLAVRLADAGHTVLLIEAGGPPPYFADIPILAPLFQQSPYDWQYKTVPQVHACRGLINNQSSWHMGRVLGGSSRLNYMAYVKGHPSDYADWFPDYDDYALDDSVTSDPRWYSQLCESVLGGIDELSETSNTESEYSLNFSKVKLTMTNGERWSTDRLLYAKYRPNLKVLTHSYVDKIKFRLNKAEGIEFTKWRKRYYIKSRRGVVVSAGAIGTPKLLMLSGVGPKEHLNELKIDVVADLPVGKYLMDHIITGVGLVILNETLGLNLAQVLAPKSAINYFLFRQGPWTSAAVEIVGTLHHHLKNNSGYPPELQFMILPTSLSQDYGVALRKAMGISDKIFDDYFSPLIGQTAISFGPVLLHPKSLGVVKLQSSNPQDDPIIDPKYLSHKDDVLMLIKGIEFIERVINTEAMKALGASLYEKPFPGCENLIFRSINYWECYVRHLTLTSYHPAGTCRVGSVVDKSFRVFNTQNLYVVDASVLPKLPSGNINAAVMMVAEKASALLIQSIKRQQLLNKCSRLDSIKYIFLFSEKMHSGDR